MNLESVCSVWINFEAANQIRNLDEVNNICIYVTIYLIRDIAQEIADLFCEDAIGKASAVYTKTNWGRYSGRKTLPK